MATITELDLGQIATPAGADRLRGELLSAHTVRCGQLWHAAATIYSDGAAEIEISASYDRASESWRAIEYYYSFEVATRALRQFEQTGVLPTEGEL